MNKKVLFAFIIVLAFFFLTTERKQAEAQKAQPEYDGWIVSFDSAKSPEGLGLDQWGKVTKYARGKNFPYSFAVVRPQSGKRPVSDLSRMQGIRRVEPNYVVHVDWAPNDPMYISSQQWYLGPTATNMAAAWPTSTSETIGIIDTGCASHEDLPTIPSSDKFTVLDGNITVGVANDTIGHGTLIQGTIEAMSNNSIGITGIVWGPNRFLCIKSVNDATGLYEASDLYSSIQIAKDQGVKFLNASWGMWDTPLLRDSVSYFLDQGDSYLFASCGNAFPNGTSPCNYPASYSNSMEGVIAVGAVDQNLNLAYFANYGPTLTFVEPGVYICSTSLNGGYTCRDGTSFAVPIALGIASATHNAFPLPRGAFLQHLKNKAVDLGSPGFDSQYGWGMLTSKTLEKYQYFLPMLVR